MNDTIAKVCLAVIALAAIGAGAYLGGGAIAASLITLAGVCAGAIGGVAVQGAFKATPVETPKDVVL